MSNGYPEQNNSPNSSQLSGEHSDGAPTTLISRTQKQHTTQQVYNLFIVDNFIYVVIVMDWVPEISVRRQIGDAFSSYFVPKKIKKIYVQLWANSRYPFHVYLYPIRDIDFIRSFLKFLEKPKLRTTSRYSSINILRSPSNFELARLGLKKHCLLLSSWSIKKRVIKCKKRGRLRRRIL